MSVISSTGDGFVVAPFILVRVAGQFDFGMASDRGQLCFFLSLGCGRPGNVGYHEGLRLGYRNRELQPAFHFGQGLLGHAARLHQGGHVRV